MGCGESCRAQNLRSVVHLEKKNAEKDLLMN